MNFQPGVYANSGEETQFHPSHQGSRFFLFDKVGKADVCL